MSAILWTAPCVACCDDECGSEGCAMLRSAEGIVFGAGRIAAAIAGLPGPQRERAGRICADLISDALGVCGARLDRRSFFAACGIEVAP